jgi:tRNA threonylcarbamoyladenosine biosynthesis protein TsaB
MSLVLNIETATRHCSVGIARDGNIIAARESDEKNIHARSVTVFTEEVCREADIEMREIDAVAVSKGPGSYTGLRIGVSAAKGFCYALGIKLISVPTLQSMALKVSLDQSHVSDDLFCPMIDARRMEVYTALFDRNNKVIKDTEALIVDDTSFQAELKKARIFYFGDGASKCREILDPKGMIFLEGIYPDVYSMAKIAQFKYDASEFEDLAYFEPFYLKDFIAGVPKVKGLK